MKPVSSSSGEGTRRPDYHAEGLKLIGLHSSEYSGADVIWEHPSTWAQLFVGNLDFAENKQLLLSKEITDIVNCQSEDSDNFHTDDERFSYLHFPIEHWQEVENIGTSAGVMAYFGPLFEWIDSRLAERRNVLVHCLAGAHRAGTAGTAYVMYKTGESFLKTLDVVRARRPCIDPIYDLADLLRRLEEGTLGHKSHGVGESGLEGTWVYNRGQSRYKIYQNQMDGKLLYMQPLKTTVLEGVLESAEVRAEDCDHGRWEWAASISNGANIRFRREGILLVSNYRQANKQEWGPDRFAELLNG